MKKLIVLLAAAAMIAGISGCVCTSQCEKAAKPACCGDACSCTTACEASCTCCAKPACCGEACTCTAACESSCSCCAKPACDKAKKVKEPKTAPVKEPRRVSKKKAAEAETP